MITSDILHAVFAQLMVRVAGLVFPIALLASTDMVSRGPSLGLWPTHFPYLVQIFMLVFLADGVAYWLHRLSHEVPWLWSIHVVHHAPQRLNVTKGARHHAAYMVIRYFVVLVPFVLIGAPPGVVIWYIPCLFLLGPLSHANADLKVPHSLDRILLTPQVHQLHHSSDIRLGNSNYAVIFPVWDVLFGTFSDPAREETGTVGVPSEPLPRGFWQDIIRPFVTGRMQVDERTSELDQRRTSDSES